MWWALYNVSTLHYFFYYTDQQLFKVNIIIFTLQWEKSQELYKYKAEFEPGNKIL